MTFRTCFLTIASVIYALTTYGSERYTILCDTLHESRIYPGTIHQFNVSVPTNYDPEAPAALFLCLDGMQCNAPDVIDSLSHAGKMPLTIGVYLRPGIVLSADNEVLRYNRSNEFDATDSRFASFLETEVLPAVESIKLPDGRRIRLTSNPSDRMIFGLSSGGIASFNAAWHRPDLFGKIFSSIGTFVPMRGGNDYPAIVRKHEPKPLRIFLQDGYSDTWNPLFGSWYEANKALESSLIFAGYDCKTDWSEGGHDGKRAAEILSDVLTWMWRDGSEPIACGNTSNDLLSPLLIAGESWTAATYQPITANKEAIYPDNAHSVCATPGSNYLTQSIIDKAGNRVYSQPFYWLHTYGNNIVGINGMAFDANGNLWVLTDCNIQICDQNGRVRGILDIPVGFTAQGAGIRIDNGSVTISNGKYTYTRRFNIDKPTSGVRPPSQGEG